MKRFQRAAAVLTAAVLTLGILSGCTEKPEPAATATAPEEISVCLGGAVFSLDPIRTTERRDSSILCHLYENLLKLTVDESGATTAVAGMAKSWESEKNVDGSVTYTFRLRNAKWSDGSAVSAKDFVYAWQRLADPVTQSPQAHLLSVVKGFDEVQATGDVSALQVEAKNSSTFVVTLSGTCEWFLTDVCTAAATMPLRQMVVQELKEAAIQKNQEDAANGLPMTATWCSDYTKLVTNGPYLVESFDDTGLTMVRSEFYSENEDGPERIRVVYADTAEDGWALYEAGEVDFLAELPESRLTALAEDPQWAPLPLLSTCLLLFNTESTPFDNPMLRQAYHLAIDRTALSDAAGAACLPAGGLVPFGVSDPEDTDFRTHGGDLVSTTTETYSGNCTEAAGLLETAGYESGLHFPALELLHPDTERHGETARLLAEMWQNVLNTTVVPVAMAEEELEAALAAGEFSLALTDFTGYANDAQSFLDAWAAGSKTNVVGYSNTAFDTLLTVITSASDDQARRGCLHDAESLLLESVPLSPLYFIGTDYALRDDLTGVSRSALGVFRFTDILQLLA